MSEDNWTDVSPSTELDYFADWLSVENFLGEYGEPGFHKMVREFILPSVNPGYAMPFTFNILRSDDGLLIGVVINYMMNGVRKPWVAMTHPDRQRQGVMTRLANLIIADYEQEYQLQFSFSDSWSDLETTESAANFVNKYAKTAIEGRNQNNNAEGK
jgi:hypothetical protein